MLTHKDYKVRVYTGDFTATGRYTSYLVLDTLMCVFLYCAPSWPCSAASPSSRQAATPRQGYSAHLRRRSACRRAQPAHRSGLALRRVHTAAAPRQGLSARHRLSGASDQSHPAPRRRLALRRAQTAAAPRQGLATHLGLSHCLRSCPATPIAVFATAPAPEAANTSAAAASARRSSAEGTVSDAAVNAACTERSKASDGPLGLLLPFERFLLCQKPVYPLGVVHA